MQLSLEMMSQEVGVASSSVTDQLRSLTDDPRKNRCYAKLSPMGSGRHEIIVLVNMYIARGWP